MVGCCRSPNLAVGYGNAQQEASVARLEIRKVRTVSGVKLAEGPLTIGRSSSNEVVLKDSRVSRHHCVVEIVDGQPEIRDSGSQKGTFVNGEKLNGQARALVHGDLITIRPFELVFDHPESAKLPPPSTPDTASQENSLRAELADAAAQLQQARAHTGEMEEEHRSQIQSLEQRLCELGAEWTAANALSEQRLAERDAAVAEKTQAEQRLLAIESSTREAALLGEQARLSLEKKIADLESQSALQRDKIKELESNTRIAGDTALRASRALIAFAGQVQALEEAAQELQMLEDQLADAEAAWSEMEQTMQMAAAADAGKLEAAETLRQHLSTQLIALTRQRDDASHRLREAACSLRSQIDRSGSFDIVFNRPAENPSRLKKWLGLKNVRS
jgi:hypothetical protein